MSAISRAVMLRQQAKLYRLTVESYRPGYRRHYMFYKADKGGENRRIFMAIGIGEAEKLLDAYQQGYNACAVECSHTHG